MANLGQSLLQMHPNVKVFTSLRNMHKCCKTRLMQPLETVCLPADWQTTYLFIEVSLKLVKINEKIYTLIAETPRIQAMHFGR